ncbi:uncharacterized protein PAC_03466 [Phialocephala subalpina]|uniref:Yeast cell wall synthesis Kre9/Knh1-like N-terminal domain-containing protein n=1 Tax=Phialocephala subalpina TaxID=576137 RepID=A0A1L7WLE2_9HELO|nr:uncharacterized protein PAC_03466 [Phialocephala subalpina]
MVLTMYLSTLAFFVLAHSASVFAQTQFFDVLTSPPTGSNYVAGSVLPIVWTPGDSTGTISIVLNGGSSPSTLELITSVAKGIDTKLGGLNWTIPSGVGSFATYGLNLTLDSDSANTFQSSFPFHITGGTTIGSDTSSSSSSGVSISATTSSGSATASGTVSTSASGSVSSSAVIQSTPSATFSTTGTTSAGTTLTTSSATGFSNGTATKTSSSKTSGTSSSSTSSSTVKASGAAGNVVSASLALLAALAFAVAL